MFSFTGKRTIKDIIEALGIPHTEVDLILANGESVDFNYYPQADDYISIYPIFETLDIHKVTRLRPRPLRDPKFILDVHLGTLSRYLRLAGFDSYYRNDLEDQEIINISLRDNRIILTRDLPLLKNGRVTHGYFVRETNPKKQFIEVTQRFHLQKQLKPFTRCLDCNGIIQPVDKEQVKEDLQVNTLKYTSEFYRCSECGKVYWKGSHYQRLKRLIEEV